jgi:hypothetical protein
MKPIKKLLCGLFVLGGFVALFSLLHAQETDTSNQSIQMASDLDVMLQAVEATTPMPATNAPDAGNFYSAQHAPGSEAEWPPLPADVLGLPIWPLGDGYYVLDDANVDYDALVAAQTRTASRGKMMSMDESGGGGFTPMLVSIPTNSLYLQITNVANGLAYLTLNNATDQVYEIWSKTDLTLTNWNIEQEVWPTNPAVMPFIVPTLDRTNLFVWARDWTGFTSNGNETPEWWFWKYFGTVDLSDSDLDSLGMTLLDDYQNGLDPNIIQFTLQFTNSYVNTGTANGTVTILGGIPAYMAVLVNDTNLADASWQPYTSSNVVVPLGSTNGIYNVSVGLRGLPADAHQIWLGTQLTLNSTGPVLTITNPVTTTVSVPMIQLQGFVDESLSSLTFDVSNVAGVFTNQTGYVTGQFYDTNLLAFTTDYFQCYDVPLTNGVNVITLHATDLAGNTTTTNISITVDYSGVTSPPALTLIWPQDGAQVSGGSFTLQAQVDDATATVTASITDTNGDTTVVPALIERSGAVWVKNLPLNSGTNFVTVTATNAAGLGIAANLDVVQSAVTVTTDPISSEQLNQPSMNVTGSINNPADNVTVNGVGASLYYVDDNGIGYWEADGVTVSPTGTANLDVEVTDADNNPLGSQKVSQPQPATTALMSYESSYHYVSTGVGYGDGYGDVYYNWTYLAGGRSFGHEVLVNQGDDDYNESWNDSIPAGLGAFAAYTSSTVNENLSAAWTFNDFFNDFGTIIGTYETYSHNATAQMVIVPSGQSAIGTTCLYLVGVSALAFTNPMEAGNIRQAGDVPMAPETLQINGQALVNSGITNADGSVSGLALVSGAADAPVPLVVSSASAANYSFQTNLLQQVHLAIIDTNSGTDLTAQTNTVIVGQQMNFTCQLSITNQFMTNFPLANFLWTVPGTAISNYLVAADTNSAIVWTNFSTTSSNVVFYWSDGASNFILQCSATVDGKPVTGQAVFNVLKPSADLIAFTNGAVTIDANGDSSGVNLYWGKAPLLFTSTNYGIRFYATNIVLNGCPSSSTFKYVQLGTIQAEHNYTNGTSTQYTGSGLDTRYPAFSFSATEQFDHEEDEPSEPVGDSAQVWRSDHFTMYLLFQPNSANSIPVPLKKLDWSWSGVGQTNGTGGWQLLSSSTSLQNVNVSADYPTWTSNAITGTTTTSNQWINPFP